MQVRLSAFAKVNLDLRILAREASGFHQLETIFQRISLADDVEVHVGPGTGIQVRCEPPVDVPDEQNLAWRAAAAYRAAAHWPAADVAIRIAITKRIPAGGGLGGGSADAGAVLRALNALNPAPLSAAMLLNVAATLGADVPFLSTDIACVLAWGRGERMLAIAPPLERTVHLATFRDGVNTAAAYRELARAREAGAVVPHGAALRTADSCVAWPHLAQDACNDFEGPVFALRPDVAAVHAAWARVAPAAVVRMSGSGATVFAIASDADAPAIAAVAGGWPADGAITYHTAQTLTTVPAPSILSVSSRFR